MDERDLVEKWNRMYQPGQQAMSSYQRVMVVGRAFCLGGVACVWTHELPYPVKLNTLQPEDPVADPGVGMWGVVGYPSIPTVEEPEPAREIDRIELTHMAVTEHGLAAGYRVSQTPEDTAEWLKDPITFEVPAGAKAAIYQHLCPATRQITEVKFARGDGEWACADCDQGIEAVFQEPERVVRFDEMKVQRGLAQRMHDGDTEAAGARCGFPVEIYQFGFVCSSPECGWTLDGAELMARDVAGTSNQEE